MITIPFLVALIVPSPAAEGDEFTLVPFSEADALAALTGTWEARMEAFDVPGAAIAVVRGGDAFVHAMGTGTADGRHEVDAHTMFYIASITKTFNALAMCALVEDGRLSLDDPVKEHLPRFDLPEKHQEVEATATVRDLLSHRWGFGSGPIVLLDAYSGEITDDRYWYWLARGSVAARPEYTNVNFTLAGKVIEEVTGEDWRDWLDERVLVPAGMTRTTGYASRLYGDPNAAIPLERDGDVFAATAQRKTDRTMHAAGGLGISAADGARWVALNLNGGRIGETQVVDEALVEEMQFPHQEREPESILGVVELTDFCLGWQRGTLDGVPVLAHGGGYVGAFAFVALLPEHEAGFFVLANSGDLANVWGLAVAADCTAVLTNNEISTERWDQFAGFADRFRAQNGDGAGDGEPVTAENLSRPIGLYAGSYHSEWLGTLHVEHDGERLAVRLGDAPQPVRAASAIDAIRLDGDGDSARFIVGPGGEIDEVRAHLEDVGEVVFRR